MTRLQWQVHECAWAKANPEAGWSGSHCVNARPCKPTDCRRKAYAAAERRKTLSKYRQFPGSPFMVATQARADQAKADGITDWWGVALPKATCRWCGGRVMDHKKPGHLNLRRAWHDGRNGEPDCLRSFYGHTRSETQREHLRERDGLMCRACGVQRGFDVDHVVALSIVAIVILQPYRWAYHGPGNLQLLCGDCHRIKTRQDVIDLKLARLSCRA